MANDNLTLNPGVGGETMRALRGIDGTLASLGIGGYATSLAPGANVVQPVTPAHGLPIQPQTGVTFPVSVAALPLPAGAAQDTTLAALAAKILNCDTSNVTITALPGGGLMVSGNAADGAADSGNPLKMGALYQAFLPNYSDGQRSTLHTDANGRLITYLGTKLDPGNDGLAAFLVNGFLSDGNGGTLVVKTARGQATASGVNAAVATVAGKRIRVLSYSCQAANANGASVVTANWQDDSGSPVVLSQGWDLGAREGVSKPGAPGMFYFQTTVSQALKLNLSGALTVNWELTYVEA